MQTSAAKHATNRATHYATTRQDWRHSEPYLELDDCTISAEKAPRPCPLGRKVFVGGVTERKGAVVVMPSPWISDTVNRRVAAVLKVAGFELRKPEDNPHFVESYVVEWVRFCNEPQDGQRYSAKAWLEWATRKHKELYNVS